MHGARTSCLDATRDLFTAGSVQYDAVATAWRAVGVS
jgi:Zn-dependent metalloprotease